MTTKLNKNKAELHKIFAKREAEDRADEIAKKKLEAKRAQEDRVKKLSPSEQRKFDEKERNRELKKEQKKRTKRAWISTLTARVCLFCSVVSDSIRILCKSIIKRTTKDTDCTWLSSIEWLFLWFDTTDGIT